MYRVLLHGFWDLELRNGPHFQLLEVASFLRMSNLGVFEPKLQASQRSARFFGLNEPELLSTKLIEGNQESSFGLTQQVSTTTQESRIACHANRNGNVYSE